MFKRLCFTLLPCILLAATGCTDLSEYERDRVNDALADSLLTVTESTGVRMDLIEDGFRRVSVTAPRAITWQRENNQSETELRETVHVVVRDSAESVSTRVRSERARYIAHESAFHFMGDVFVETNQNRRLYTEYLEWSQDSRQIRTPEFVIIVTAADSITGFGLDGSDDLETYRLREISGEFQIERRDP